MGANGREGRPCSREPLVGVAGLTRPPSPSTRLRNWRAVRGEPGEEWVLMECGLRPLGVDSANDGSKAPPLPGSGVFGARGGVISSGASRSVEELIHFSSLEPRYGIGSGKRRNMSAK